MTVSDQDIQDLEKLADIYERHNPAYAAQLRQIAANSRTSIPQSSRPAGAAGSQASRGTPNIFEKSLSKAREATEGPARQTPSKTLDPMLRIAIALEELVRRHRS